MPESNINEWFSEAAPAKINLNLHVTGRRPDGHHAIQSLAVFADCGDELAARLTPGEDRLGVAGPFGNQISNGSENLVMRAIAKFRARWPGAIGSALEVELTKNLPIAAGIGGGSSDAAAMLRILNRLSSEPVPPSNLLELALELGADVPVCLHKKPVIMGGIGQQLGAPVKLPEMSGILINPMKPVATSQVFQNLERRENQPLPPLPEHFSNAGALANWLLLTRNDLTEAATLLVPEIARITGYFQQNQHCLLARMSGSGASVFALFETRAQAENAASGASRKWPGYWIERWSLPA